MSVRPSVHTEQLSSHWTDFHEILYLSIFRKYIENMQLSFKSNDNRGYFTLNRYTFFLSYLVQFFLK